MNLRVRSVLMTAIILGGAFLAGVASQAPGSTFAFQRDTPSSTSNVLRVATDFPGSCETPGPDSFGYRCAEVAYAFEDIRTTGTAVSLSDDSVTSLLNLGFTFSFYGNSKTQVRISSNGFLLFTGTANGCCSGQQLPNTADPDDLVSGYWEDLYPPCVQGANAGIKYQTKGVSPQRRFIAQFTGVSHYSCSAPYVTFQMVLNETGRIQVNYENAGSDGGTHSAGIENSAGSVGLRYKYGNFGVVQKSVRYTPPGLASQGEPEPATPTGPGGAAGAPDNVPEEPVPGHYKATGTGPWDWPPPEPEGGP